MTVSNLQDKAGNNFVVAVSYSHRQPPLRLSCTENQNLDKLSIHAVFRFSRSIVFSLHIFPASPCVLRVLIYLVIADSNKIRVCRRNNARSHGKRILEATHRLPSPGGPALVTQILTSLLLNLVARGLFEVGATCCTLPGKPVEGRITLFELSGLVWIVCLLPVVPVRMYIAADDFR